MTVKIDGSTGVDKVQPLSIEQEDLKWVPPFTKEYVSPEQVITAAGALTLAHGLGTKPKLFSYALVCKTAEGGYSVGDEVDWMTVQYTTVSVSINSGFTNCPDAVNLNIRFGATAAVFYLLNKSTGGAFSAANANWRLVVRAWA